MLSGLKVVVSEHALAREWVYPKERFFQYEPSPETEKWCRYFGFGHEKTTPASYIIGGHTLLIHPVLWEELKKHVG